eukprot:TRINITY_DN7486_c0_g1_i4.p1 TRINITY_DN7486_c0_g1~~TRINITY_DN7486_c0_g1_i4.p1  ORF type:complete len:326 (-),score=77.44 TRINITY_DN7486_c0_g1_i4:17-994(-)
MLTAAVRGRPLLCLAVLGAFLAVLGLQGCSLSSDSDKVTLIAGSCAGKSEAVCGQDSSCTWVGPRLCWNDNPLCENCFEEYEDCASLVTASLDYYNNKIIDNNDSNGSNGSANSSFDAAYASMKDGVKDCCNRASKCLQVVQPTVSSGGGYSGSAGAASFAAGSLVQFADGSWRRVEDIRLGDNLAMGGLVTGRMEFFAQKEELFLYRTPGASDARGIVVAASHAVLEGGVWRRVRDARGAVPIDESLWRSLLLQGETKARLYDFDVENHRLVVQGAPSPNGEASGAGVVFADFSEVDIGSLAVQSFEASLLALLQAEQDAKIEV